MEWISVKDDLPGFPRQVFVAYESDSDGEPCLDVGEAVLFPDGIWRGMGLCYRANSEHRYVLDIATRKVTHWMPKIKPPQSSSKTNDQDGVIAPHKE